MVCGGPGGGFRKVREAGRNSFLLFSLKSDLMVPSYVKKQKLTIKKATTNSMRAQSPEKSLSGLDLSGVQKTHKI